MASLIYAKDIPEAYALANNEILVRGVEAASERGNVKFINDLLVVVERPEVALAEGSPHAFHFSLLAETPNEVWRIGGVTGVFEREETYADRFRKPLDQIGKGVELIRRKPYSRRFCVSVARPWDVLSRTPPALMEIYVQVLEAADADAVEQEDGGGRRREERKEVHVTGFFRSVDVFNYLNLNLNGLCELQELICRETGYEKGSIAAHLVNAHYYLRNERQVEKVTSSAEARGATRKSEREAVRLGGLIKTEHLPSGWRETLELIYRQGLQTETEWGEVFERKRRAKFAHRLLLEIERPSEDMEDDKAPFTRKYLEEYALRYVLGTTNLPATESEILYEEGEAYTYASRARYEPADMGFFELKKPVDQLYHAIELLRKDKRTRRATIVISRPWDILSEDPACLRGYVFHADPQDPEALRITLFMRSNDAYGATLANQFAFTRLAEFVAAKTGFESVKLTLLAANMHIYEDAFEFVEGLLKPKMPSFGEFFS
ncbi:MAG: hypothetical protein DRN91_07560 [Candidatus Alkanophagales archaeon]|nr:MAG: hypothetical protein DRN91_07560 [Candidatus Alkanophagales archaeon]